MSLILVVDDEPDQLTVLALLLELEQFDVVTAPNGAQALELAKSRPVALVLTDLMMPAMDGLALCRALREDPSTRQVPIILNSAGAVKPDGQGTLYDVFMVKPALFQEQLSHIRRLLKTHQQ